MPGSEAYRDELAAAQERIERLERALAERVTTDARSSAVAALLRERTRVVDATVPWSVWPKMVWLFVVFSGVGVVFLLQGDWLFGGMSVLAPLLMGVVGQRVVNANAENAARQLALVDARLAELEQGLGTKG